MSVESPARSPEAGNATVARLLASLDDAGDAAFGRLRGRPWADAAAAAVSNLSDYGYIWVAAALWKARRPGPGRRRAVAELAGAGITSYAVNRAAKLLVGRGRPEGASAGGAGLVVRRPTSSSFPSGHTLAAFCTALVLTESPAATTSALTFAGLVAASRVHLRAHHASDVLGGAVIGVAAGAMVRRVIESFMASE